MHGNDILVVGGSVRPVRRSHAIAAWVAALGREAGGARFDIVDLRELGLALDDEPDLPAKGLGYAAPATRRWSAMVTEADAVAFVTPQYNWGYPAALKNAIDHLHAEWRAKPVLVITYGGHGGERCAAQLRQVLQGLDARLTDASPGLHLHRSRIEADDGAVEPEADFATHREDVSAALRELVELARSQPARPA